MFFLLDNPRRTERFVEVQEQKRGKGRTVELSKCYTKGRPEGFRYGR